MYNNDTISILQVPQHFNVFFHRTNPVYKFQFIPAGYDTACAKPNSVEGIGLFHSCTMKSSAAGR